MGLTTTVKKKKKSSYMVSMEFVMKNSSLNKFSINTNAQKTTITG